MRLALFALAATLGACAMPLTDDYAVQLGVAGQVRLRANAPGPRYFMGLSLSLVSRRP